jgi:hypothetical protein
MTVTAAAYRIVHTNPTTGLIRDDLPIVNGFSFTETLNAEGGASFTIPLNAPEADPLTFAPGISGVAILRDNVPVWGGLVWTMSADLAGGTLTVNASGYHSHYRGRFLVNGYSAQDRDQASMVRDWLDSTTTGISTEEWDGLATTGRLRSRAWTKYEFKNVAEAIEELAEESGGFNFRYEPYLANDGFAVGNRFRLTEIGSESIPVTLTHRLNCDVTKVDYDGSQMATHTHALGADTGNGEKLMGSSTNPDLIGPMPEKRTVASFTDIKETETLAYKADVMLDIGRAPVAIPSLTIYPGQFSPADFKPGQSGLVQVDSGYVALLDEFVITERSTSVNANGSEVITLSLANREVFGNGQ